MKLAKKLHISEVETLVQELNALLKSSQPIHIDVSDVQSVDTATIQAFCSLQKSLNAIGDKIHWQGINKSFLQAVDTLGLTEFLSITK